MQTGLLVKYTLIDVTASEDADFSTNGTQTFCDVSNLKGGNVGENYITLENDLTLLDGNFQEMPDEPTNIVYFSAAQSDENGEFTTNPTITIDFDTTHSSVGLTLHFLSNIPEKIKLTFYNSLNWIVAQKEFVVDSLDFFADILAQNYKKVVLEVEKTNPYNFVKLNSIDFGLIKTYGENDIVSANENKEVDFTSDKISIDTFNFEIYDKLNDFEMGNVDGLHNFLQPKQKANVYSVIDGNTAYMNSYYLKDFTNSNKKVKLNLQSAMNVLDNYTFYKGKIYNGVSAGSIINEIFSMCGLSDYEVDTETFNTLVYGTIGLVTCRKALREVLFATNSIILNEKGNNHIIIKKQNKTIQSVVDLNRKFSTSAKKAAYYSKATITYKDYTEADKSSQIVKGTYPAGNNFITFKTPAKTITANVGTITEQSTYYCILSLEQASEVVISGIKYNSTDISVSAEETYLTPGQTKSEKKYSGTLFNYDTAKMKCEKLLEYLEQPLEITTKFLNLGEDIGEFGIYKNPNKIYNDYIVGAESMKTNLTGGFVTTITARGAYNMLADYSYTDEFYADEWGLI